MNRRARARREQNENKARKHILHIPFLIGRATGSPLTHKHTHTHSQQQPPYAGKFNFNVYCCCLQKMLNELNDWADPDRGGRRRLMGESLLNSREFLMNAYFTDE